MAFSHNINVNIVIQGHCIAKSVEKASNIQKLLGSPLKTDKSSSFSPEDISLRDCVTQLTLLPRMPQRSKSCPLFTTLFALLRQACSTATPLKSNSRFTSACSPLLGRRFSSPPCFTSSPLPSPTNLAEIGDKNIFTSCKQFEFLGTKH